MSRPDTRAKIIAAARNVFAEKGYRGARVEDILVEAPVARATFYKYFHDKRELYLEIIHTFLENIYGEVAYYLLEGSTSEEIVDALHASLPTFYSFLLDNRGMIKSYLVELYGSDPSMAAVWDDFAGRMVALFEGVLQRGVASGELRAMNIRRVARALLLILFQGPFNELVLAGRSDIDVGAIASEMVDLAMRGIVARD